MREVISVAFPFAPVTSTTPGGAEQILRLLDNALLSTGCRSLVIAHEDSRISGELIPFSCSQTDFHPRAMAEVRQHYRCFIQAVVERHNPCIIHFHGVDCFDYLPDTSATLLITLHLPPDHYPPELYEDGRPNLNLVCVSAHQFSITPKSEHLLTYIPNGVEVSRFWYRSEKENYVLCLGRICPEKGFHLAIDAAAAAGIPVLIAGKVFPYESHMQYFEEEIRPRLGPNCRFIGVPDARQKLELLAHARAVLIPSLIGETSSLVAMEALSSGTPVIAFPSGALPEVVEDGKTGFLVQDDEEMSAAITHTHLIDPAVCRETACRRFSANRMAADYLNLYSRLVS